MLKLIYFFTLSLYLLHGNTPMETLYLKNACNACHGMYGEGIGSTPRLQGKTEIFLRHRLRDLQQGKTRTAFGSVMISFAKALNDKQTVQMAKYLSTLKTVIHTDRYDEAYDPNDDGGS